MTEVESQHLRVLLADDDPAMRAFLRELLMRFGFAVTEARDGNEAIALARARDAPRILVLDWKMPGLDGVTICRLLRQEESIPRRYILLCSAKSSRKEIAAALGSGADDFIGKPIAPEVFYARMRVAHRMMLQGQSSADLIGDAFREACAMRGGELVVRSGDVIGRVYFHRGSIAWAHVSGETDTLLSLLHAQGCISAVDAEAVVLECRRTGRSFDEVLTDWKLVDRPSLRESARRWVSSKVISVLVLEYSAVMFMPQDRSYRGDLLFSLEELLPDEQVHRIRGTPARRDSLPPAAYGSGSWPFAFADPGAEDAQAIASQLRAGIDIDGAVAVALLDRARGVCLAQAGASVNEDLAWAQIHTINACEAYETVEDIMVRTNKGDHLICTLPGRPELFLYLLVNQERTAVARARLSLRTLADSISSGLDARAAQTVDGGPKASAAREGHFSATAHHDES
jgi:CheY-like chemotaxis protein